MKPQEFQKQLAAWAEAHPGIFDLQPDPEGMRLTEIESGKSLRLLAERVQAVEVKKNWNTGSAYLLLSLESLPPLAIADAGFVFGLDTRNTGELHGAPPTMSFRDFRRLHAHLLHLVEQQAVLEHRAEALDVMMILIASLDGARLLGIPTETEEIELDKTIRRLEAGA